MKRLLIRWLKSEIIADLRTYLRERALKLPSSQIDALAKKFKVKPEVLESLNEEIAIRVTDFAIKALEELLEKKAR